MGNVGQHMATDKMPGHWVLAQLGKRVLRPGGLELTRKMLDVLSIQRSDAVVEFAPGLGVTARLTLGRHPASYTAIERDATAAAIVRQYLTRPNQRCHIGSAAHTDLPDAAATVVYGEAMLTMQTNAEKTRIIRESARILKTGGRYGIHEIALVPDDIDDAIRTELRRRLSKTILHRTEPLTLGEWRQLLEAEGFAIQTQSTAPMHLLEPRRLIQDEGLSGAVRFLGNVLRHPQARRRVLAMRRVFRQYATHMTAVTFVAVKANAQP